MFGFFKRLFAKNNAIAEDIAAVLDEENQKWCAMSAEELAALPDDELLNAVNARIAAVIGDEEDETARIALLNNEQRIIYVADLYQAEVNNGGLCQYFVNDSRFTAPMLCDALATIGAEAHRMHFDVFIRDNAIDLTNLESFAINHIRQYAKMEKRYPFEAFDNAFYAMPSIEEPILAFIRTHITKF